MDGFKTAAQMVAEGGAGDGIDLEDALSQPDAPGKVVKLTEDGGVVKEIVTPGHGWEVPEKGDKVQVHYVGTLQQDGSQFDSSRDRGEPFEFTLGEGSVIKGWDVGVATMKRGEVSRLVITADYGYGAGGSPPKIPGGATLIFEVELISWKSIKDIAGDGGVIKTVEAEGSGWAKPQSLDEVCVSFSARVQGAPEPFYTSAPEGEVFGLQSAHFCRALPTAAATMKKGEQARLVVRPDYGFGDAGRGAEVPGGATLELDLTLLTWHRVEKVTDDGLVMKKTLGDTEEWARPNAGAQCTISYIARLLPAAAGGTPLLFDERTADNPLQFTSDEGQVPDGLDRAVRKMKSGERALVTVAPQYAFGAQDSQQPLASVPAGSTVEYDVTLISFVKAKDTWEMDTAEKLAAAAAQKDKGNALFKAGHFSQAVAKYDQAVQCVEHDDSFSAEEKRQSRDVKKSCHLNLAAAHLKLQRPVDARKAADKVLEVDSGNLKALYRRAQAWLATEDYVEAELDIRAALAGDPDNADFKALLKKWRVAQAAAGKKEASLYSGMLKGLGRAEPKKKPAADAAAAVTTPAAEELAPAAAADTDAAAAAEAPMEQP